MWTIERVTEELNKLATADNIAPIKEPIRANSRLRSTLGRVKFTAIDNVILSIHSIEFSAALLQNGTDNDIMNVIKHEYAHYFLFVSTGEKHGHDAMFKRKCAEIGCTHDKTHGDLESTYNDKKEYKYEVYCIDCIERIGQYSRMCKTLKNLSSCKCGKCGGNHLIMKQNW